MKIFQKTILYLFSTLAMFALIILLFFKQETYQLYKVLTFFDKDQISENFRSIDQIFQTSLVPKPDVSSQFASAESFVSLPASFQSGDSVFKTQEFLDFTLTDALLVLKNDTIVFEYYSNGFESGDQHISWSMSKSVISALFGIAISEGKIESIEQTVTDYLPDFVGTGYDGVRIKDVLQMSSGVGFNEDYGDFNSDINVLGRYFALGMPMSDFAKTLKRKYEPGTYNHYVSVNTQILGMILVKATGQSIADYMSEKLWNPIEATSEAYWIIDKAGMEFALGGLNITTIDYARLGQLYLDSGRWNGNQIIPENWVIASITPDAPHLMPGVRKNAVYKEGYGFQWWIPVGADDEFNAQGIYGQYIYIDPDQDVVIVKLASNYHFKTDVDNKFYDIEIDLLRSIVSGLNQ